MNRERGRRRAELSHEAISSFQIARVFGHHQKSVNSMDFSFDGLLLVSSGADDVVNIYLAREGNWKRTVPVKKYGAGALRFLRDRNVPTVITTSTTGLDHQIRAIELNNCTYVRYFPGHEERVISLASSPISATFISASLDRTMRLWDARQPAAAGKLKVDSCPAVAFDPKGVVFGVTCTDTQRGTMVKLYDVKQYQQGPFIEFPIPGRSASWPTCFKFSTDGEYFLLTSADASPSIQVFDAYKGAHYRSFVGHRNDAGIPLESSFSPDSKYLATGSTDGSLYIWDIASEKLLLEKKKVHAQAPTCVIWNPVFGVAATACQKVALWIPDFDRLNVEY